MDQLSLFGGSGPFAPVVRELGIVSTPGSSWAGNIGAMVGDLTDILGSMNLAYELEDLTLLEGVRAPVSEVHAVKERFLVLQRELVAQISECFQGEGRPSDAVALLPGPVEVFDLLQRAGGFDEQGPALKQLGGVAWAPYGYFFREWDGHVIAQLEGFRVGLKPVFRGLGTEGMRFEHLESALHEAMAFGFTHLVQRLPAQLEVVFRRRFTSAMEQLPAEVSLEDIERWWEPEEWVGDFAGLLQRSFNALLQFRMERMHALIEALCGLGEASSES